MDHALGSTFLSLYNDNQFKVKRFPEIGYTRGMKIDVIVVWENKDMPNFPG